MKKPGVHTLLFFTLVILTSNANAWFFIFPIPNLAKPPALEKLIDALEKSTSVKAVAYISEDKVFGSKHWTWSHHVNGSSQQESERIALQACEAQLSALKQQAVGGQPLYNFGNKRCELHKFSSTVEALTPSQRDANEPRREETKSNESRENRLTELKLLFEKGLITKEEYDSKRQEVLNKM